MPRTLLLILTLAALLVAGCATPTPDGTTPPSTTDATPPAPLTNTEAQQLLRSAVTSPPEVFAMDMTVKNGSVEVVSMKGSFDNATKTTYMEMRVDPAALGDEPDAAMARTMFKDGFTIYQTKDGGVWIMNATAFVLPPDDDAHAAMGGQDPTKEFRELGDPGKLFSNLSLGGDNETKVRSVTPTVYRGHPAVEIVVEGTQDGKAYPLHAIVFTSPTRLAHVEGQMPPEKDADKSPFKGGNVTMDFYYGSDAKTQPSAKATRALGLAYSSGRSPMSMMGGDDSGEPRMTWTFLHAGSVPLKDAIVEIKGSVDGDEGASDPTAGPPDLAAAPTLWSMSLAETQRSQDDVTLTFDDHDHDGLVSPGDTLTIAWTGDGERPTVALKDATTGLYVVPGAGALAALAVVALAALALRRRAP